MRQTNQPRASQKSNGLRTHYAAGRKPPSNVTGHDDPSAQVSSIDGECESGLEPERSHEQRRRRGRREVGYRGNLHVIAMAVAVAVFIGLMLSVGLGSPNITHSTKPHQYEDEPSSSQQQGTNDFCLSSDDRNRIKERCSRDSTDVCVVAVDEPTYFEKRTVGGLNESPMEIFQCRDYAQNYSGVIFEILKEHEGAWQSMTCIYLRCTFNQAAALTADKSERNPYGIGGESNIIFAGFLLWSKYRQDLGLTFSKTFYRELVVLIGVDPRDDSYRSDLKPRELIKHASEPGVYWIVMSLFVSFTLVVFHLGGSNEARREEGHDDHQNRILSLSDVWRAANKRYQTTYFCPAQAAAQTDGDRQGDEAQQRLQHLRTIHFILLLCCSGALLLFEGSLVVSTARPRLKTGQPLDHLIRDGKVYLVNNTALRESMLLSFPQDVAQHFQTCESFRSCNRIVANTTGSYLLTLESIAFSKLVNFDDVAVYHTDVVLNMFEGGFFFSSGLSKEDKDQMEDVLYNVTLKDHGQWIKSKIHDHQEPGVEYGNEDNKGANNHQPFFTVGHLLLGLGVPLAVLGVMQIILLLLCIVWALVQWQKAQTIAGSLPLNGEADDTTNAEERAAQIQLALMEEGTRRGFNNIMSSRRRQDSAGFVSSQQTKGCLKLSCGFLTSCQQRQDVVETSTTDTSATTRTHVTTEVSFGYDSEEPE